MQQVDVLPAGHMESEADNLGLLREAIARNAGIVLSLPSPSGLRHHKSRFLADAGDGFWVRSVPAERGLVRELISARQPAGVSFRSGEVKAILATEIQHWMPNYSLAGAPDGTGVEALLLRVPSEVRCIQRRKSFRVPVHATSGLDVKLWTMPDQATLREKPVASREVMCEARDVSTGGIGLTIRSTGSRPHAFATGDRVRVQLTLGQTSALLEGELRYPPRPSRDSTFRAGVQFRVLGDGKDDRQAASNLTKIVNELQRDLIRRKKLGLPVPAGP
jgi:hypothetical protein